VLSLRVLLNYFFCFHFIASAGPSLGSPSPSFKKSSPQEITGYPPPTELVLAAPTGPRVFPSFLENEKADILRYLSPSVLYSLPWFFSKREYSPPCCPVFIPFCGSRRRHFPRRFLQLFFSSRSRFSFSQLSYGTHPCLRRQHSGVLVLPTSKPTLAFRRASSRETPLPACPPSNLPLFLSFSAPAKYESAGFSPLMGPRWTLSKKKNVPDSYPF